MTDPELDQFEFTFTVDVTQFCGVTVTARTKQEALKQFKEDWYEYLVRADVYDESKALLNWDSLEIDDKPVCE